MNIEIPKNYDPTASEDKWYAYWLKHQYFKSTPDEREPFTIVIPPPNVTGILHMGHILNNTIQDVLIRKARMQGKNACWVPGTDHASIATEAKVVTKLKNEGIDKKTIGREAFLGHAFEWKEKHGGIILSQLKKLGCSCDWDRTAFTMDEGYSEAVLNVFIDLYNKGLIYRGHRMVNWDPSALTAVSDEEVIHKEVQSKLYYLKYPIEGSTSEYVVIATTRPETILADVAVCVNPNDERYAHLVGKNVIVPFANRVVPVIADEYVDIEFGTGCLKITPAHDINDYEIGKKHGLPIIDIFNANGTLSLAAGRYIGEDRFAVRKQIAIDLAEAGFIEKIEEYTNKVGYSERTDAVIEPRLSMQWFIAMKEFSKPALEAVMNDEVKIHPPKFKNTYRHWMENVRDWCISRQLWWGHRIPAWYAPDGSFEVALTAEKAIEQFAAKGIAVTATEIRQDEDVLDTWASSWLWPIAVFDGINNPDNEEINYYYPTDVLVTAPEILFFWVARMIIAGYEYRHEKPFNDVYLTGIVRDKQGRKMSKSLGNSPDPLDLIVKYGADGIRMGMLLTSPAGNDLPFDESLCEQGRNFSNKIWNSLRLIKGWNIDESAAQPASAALGIEWFDRRFNQAFAEIESHFEKFRMSDALMATYKLVWDDFCAWYLELAKPEFGKPIDRKTFDATVVYFEKLLKLLHPFMPFITEEIWHQLNERTEKEAITISSWPIAQAIDEEVIASFNRVSSAIQEIRAIRNQNNLPNKEALSLSVKVNETFDKRWDAIITRLANIDAIVYSDDKPEGAVGFLIGKNEYFVPLVGKVDAEEQREKLQKELIYQQGFLASVMKKLGNERFVAGAPAAVLENEQNKKADAEAKIKALEEQLAAL